MPGRPPFTTEPRMLQNRKSAVNFCLVLIVLLGAFLRIHTATNTLVEAPLRADAGQYYSYAYNLRFNGVYSHEFWTRSNNPEYRPSADAVRSPGYPLFLLAFVEKSPSLKGILQISLAQAALGIVSLLLVFGIAQKILPGAWPLAPTFLTALSPQLVNVETYILSESLFGFLLLLAVYVCTRYKSEDRNSSTLIVAGFLFGIATLVRPTTQYFLPVLLLYVALASRRQLQWQHYVAIACAFILPSALWTIRNVITLGITSDPTLTINTLVHGHYPEMMYNSDPATLGYPYRFDPKIQALSSSVSSALSGIWERVVDHPAQYLQWYLLGKPIAFLSWSDASADQGFFTYPALQSPYLSSKFFIFSYVLMRHTHWIWIALAIFASLYLLYQSVKQSNFANTTSVLLAFVFIYFIGIHSVGFPIARYNTPILGLVFILAFVFLYKLTEKMKNHPSTSLGADSAQK